MERKSIDIDYGGKYYTFSERNKEDADFSALQERCRAFRFKFIQENVLDDNAKMAMLMAELRIIYTAEEIGNYIFSDEDELYKVAYDSFKIANSGTTFEEFAEIVPRKELRRLIKIIIEIESDEVDGSGKKKETVKQ